MYHPSQPTTKESTAIADPIENDIVSPTETTPQIIRMTKYDFVRHSQGRTKPGASAPDAASDDEPEAKLDAGRTIRSGYAFDFDSTEPLPPKDAIRADIIRKSIGDEPLTGIEHRYAYRFVKRAFDIVFSAVVLVLLCWLFAIIAIAVKADSKGPVFFKQQRVGKNGKTFYMYKFRSMCQDAEARLAELRELNEKTGPVFKIADDPRITRVGKVIRKISLDELPQFFNVLKGDMSVVGPRPALPYEVKTYTDYQRQRLLVQGGLTCYWQTRRNRDSITFDEWIDLDLLYVKQCGPWTDFKLIIQTIGVVLTAQGS